MASKTPELGASGATAMAHSHLFVGGDLLPSPNLSHFQETGELRLTVIQVTAAADGRNAFDRTVAVPAGASEVAS